jgi:WD40 repeat protein
MRTYHVLATVLVAVALAPGTAHPQGLPDIVWEDGAHTNSVEGVAFSPDGAYIASGADYTDSSVRLWGASDGSRLHDFSLYPHAVRSVDIVPGHPYVAVGYIVTDYAPGGVAAVWDTELDQELYTTGGCHVALSPGGDMLASGGGGVNRYLFLTRVSDGFERHSIYTGSYILDVAYSPDGRFVATCGSDNDVKLWDPATGSLVRTLTGHTDDVSALAFSPDGSLLASGAGGWDDPGESTIRIWRVSDGEHLDTLEGHGDWVYALAFAPDGGALVSSGRTGSSQKIKIWDLDTGEMTRYYDESALDLDFSPYGQFLVYGRSNGDVVVALSGLTTGVGDAGGDGITRLLAAPTPNPFRSETTLRFTLDSPGEISLDMYDVSGRKVATLVRGTRPAGEHVVRWDGRADSGRRVAGGIYFAMLATEQGADARKVVLID